MSLGRSSKSCVLAALVTALILCGCEDGVFVGERPPGMPPEIVLSGGPVENDTTGYKVHFYWNAWDPDGEISHFEFVTTDGDPIGLSAADTSGLDKWTRTEVYDSIFSVTADQYSEPYDPNPQYNIFDRTHTFFIRAVDLDGMRSAPAHRSFTAWTLAPKVLINRPEGTSRTYSHVVTFGWEAWDPIDRPNYRQDPDSIRYFYSKLVDHTGVYAPTFRFIEDMNENPEFYEDRWSRWIAYNAPDGSGRKLVLGDDETLEIHRRHVFALQAKDEAGAVTALMTRGLNAREFRVSLKVGPMLRISEQQIGTSRFLGTSMSVLPVQLPAGVPLRFFWSADVSYYGAEIAGFRYGWDVQDLGDPDCWETVFTPQLMAAQERTFYSGVHTFCLEVKDNGGKVTRGMIDIEIVPLSMERNLLVVDDAEFGSEVIPEMTMPSESAHDDFWATIASRAVGFEPSRDIYDCAQFNYQPPGIATIARYRNIIWLSSNSPVSTALGRVINFIPESMVTLSSRLCVNYLSIFLKKGGHTMLEGRADKAYGGLAIVFPSPPVFPASFKHDMAYGDTSGSASMPYNDLCVSVVDKVLGTFRTSDNMPERRIDHDALKSLYRDSSDEILIEYAGMPDRIGLSGEVTCPGCFFNPDNNGFTYVEVYDPEYWMNTMMIPPQNCFHPLYRMEALKGGSPLDGQIVAIVATKYSDRQTLTEYGLTVPANSFIFGLPLWFFDHAAVDAIVGAIFAEWEILEDQSAGL